MTDLEDPEDAQSLELIVEELSRIRKENQMLYAGIKICELFETLDEKTKKIFIKAVAKDYEKIFYWDHEIKTKSKPIKKYKIDQKYEFMQRYFIAHECALSFGATEIIDVDGVVSFYKR